MAANKEYQEPKSNANHPCTYGHDWIPVRADIATVREVVGIAKRTGMSRYEVVGALCHFWGWAQRETVDGVIVDADVDALVDALALPKQFFVALITVGWLVEGVDGKDGVKIPNFDHWLGKGAKARLLKNRRQARWRNVDGHVDGHVDARNSLNTSTREEKRIDDPIYKGDPLPLSAADRAALVMNHWQGDETTFAKDLDAARDNRIRHGDYLLDSKRAAAFMRGWKRNKLQFERPPANGKQAQIDEAEKRQRAHQKIAAKNDARLKEILATAMVPK